MRLMSNNVVSTVIHASLLVLLALVGIEAFLLLLGELSLMGRGHYGFLQALLFVLLSIPGDIYQMFPLVMLLGSLIGLGTLATHNELVVMQVAGVSRMRVISWAIKAAAWMFLAAALIGEGLGPMSQHYANQYKQARLASEAKVGGSGIWVRDGRRFIHIDKVKSSRKLQGITQFQFDKKNQLRHASIAKRAQLINHQWMLSDVEHTFFTKKGAKTNYVKQVRWHVQPNLQMVSFNETETEALSLYQLRQYIQYRKHSGLNATDYQFTYWQRIFQPLSAIIMICLAVPFVFGSLRSMAMGTRIMFGASIAFVFYLLNAFFAPLSLLYQIPPVLAAILPSLLVMSVGGLVVTYVSRVHS